jgi:Protein of unknown function (DUF3106)
VRRSLLKFALGIPLLAALAAGSVSAQNGERWKAWKEHPAAQKSSDGLSPHGNGSGASRPNARAMEGLPPKWVERLRDMPPEQQQRFMQNNAQFQQLPPERQQQIRQNLEKWNGLSPDQKQAAMNREAVLERMTPEQRQYIRNILLPKWEAMPKERRQVMNRHLAMLRNMSPSTQQEALKDPQFVRGLSPDEQSMLRDLNSLRNPPPQ